MPDSRLFAPLTPFTELASHGGEGVVAQWRRVLAWPARALEQRRARAQLAELSERELADIIAAGRDLPDAADGATPEPPEERAQRALAIRAWYGKAA